MSRTTSGSGDYWSASISAIGTPVTMLTRIKPTTTPADGQIMSIDSGSIDSNDFALMIKSTSGGNVNAYTWGTSPSVAFATGAVLGTGAWHSCHAVFAASNSRASYYDGANKAVDTGNVTPAGINALHINGMAVRNINGQRAQHALALRALTDIEHAYWGIGGNARALACDHYWMMNSSGTENDLVGSINLTVHGTTSGTDNPDAAVWWTAAVLGSQSWTQGSAIPSIDFTTKFEDTLSAYTVTLKQLGAGTQVTTATGAGTASRLLTVSDASLISAGDYVSNGAAGTKSCVLYKVSNTLLLATALTWVSTDPIYQYAATTKTFAGPSISANVLSGTAAAGDVGTYTLIPRATCNNNAALFADGPAFSVTVAASGAAPSFTAGPTLNATATDGWTFGATPSASATWHLGVYLKGSTTPSVANVKAGTGTGFVSHFSKAITGADTLAATGLTNPIYDVYHVLSNGSGDSALSSSLGLQKSPPAGKQYVPITVPAISAITKATSAQITCNGHGRTTGDLVEVWGVSGMTQINGSFQACTVLDANTLTIPVDSTGYSSYTSGGVVSWGQSAYAGASVLAATGDIGIWDLATSDGLPLTPSAQGVMAYQAGTVTRRQSYSVDFYDVSGQTLVGAATSYENNVPPLVTSSSIAPGIFLPANATIAATNLVSPYASDVQGDALTVSFDTVPSGLAISSPNVSGNTGASSFTPATATYTNASGESSTLAVVWVVGSITLPDLTGFTQGQIVDILAPLYVIPTFAVQDDAFTAGPRAAGTAIAQNPLPGPASPNIVVNVTLSSGNAPPITPPTLPSVIAKSSTLIAQERAAAQSQPLEEFILRDVCIAGPTDPAGKAYRYYRIPSSAEVVDIELQNDPNGPGSLYKIGLYLPNGGNEVSIGASSLLCPGNLSMDVARNAWTSVYFPSVIGGAPSVANTTKRLWELLGLSQDPSGNQDVVYDVVITAINPGQSGGAMALRLKYIRGPNRGLITAAPIA